VQILSDRIRENMTKFGIQW